MFQINRQIDGEIVNEVKKNGKLMEGDGRRRGFCQHLQEPAEAMFGLITARLRMER